MPVLLNGGPLGYRPFSATETSRAQPGPKFRERDANCIELGLVNNMPDAALEQTERQILKLLDSAADKIVVRLSLFALPKVPRTSLGHQHLGRLCYLSVSDLWNSNLDGIIITGAEPRAPDLTQEPYWSELTDVLDWADDNAVSTACSCLFTLAVLL